MHPSIPGTSKRSSHDTGTDCRCSENDGLIGNPYKADYPEGEQIYARNIWDMQLYKGKIYLGAGKRPMG